MPPVRGVYRNPGRWRAIIDQQEIRHSTAGCLLSVVLFAPLFVRTYGVASVATAALLYAGVVVPALAGYFSLPGLVTLVCCRLFGARHDTSFAPHSSSTRPILHARWILEAIKFMGHTIACLLTVLALELWSLMTLLTLGAISWDLREVLSNCFVTLLTSLLSCLLIVAVLVLLLPMLGVPLLLHVCWKAAGTGSPSPAPQCITVNQAVLFLVAERLLLGEEVRVVGLSHLLVYSTASYVAARYFGPPPAAVTPMRGGAPSYLASTGSLMAVRLAKGVVVSVLLSLTGYQCIDARHLLYTAVTLLYYLITETRGSTRNGGGTLVSWIKNLHIPALEEDEEFWVPVLLNTLSMVTSILFLLPLILPLQMAWIQSLFTFHVSFSSSKHLTLSSLPSTNHLSFDSSSSSLTSLATSLHFSISDVLSSVLSSISSLRSNDSRIKIPRLQRRISRGNGYPDLFHIWQWSSSGWWCLLAGVGLYTNVALPAQAAWLRYVEYQRDRGGTLGRFKKASKQECLRQETCAVCLENLACGRITNCHHVYHAHCLRSLLNTNNTECPLCKRFL